MPEDPETNLARAETCVRRAKEAGALIVAFPEQFPTGWDPLSDTHLQETSGPVISVLQEYARRYRIAVLGSIRERCNDGPRNTCVMIDRTGRVGAVFAKCHLFSPAGEDRVYVPGNEISLFPLSGMKCGIAICYDLRFGALFRLYERAGAGAVFVPAAWPAERIQHWILLARARALESRMYIVGINTTGTNVVGNYSGHSIVVDP
ncbi:MAG: carbon-nitrogen hydrolase family protein, partial [Methanoregulaceae archaeon]|nr:carbon-nitrogen hydrolase family protein [Methanoregulaceae archaeon]